MAYTFDGGDKIISFDSSTTEFDVRDLYSRWVDWLLTSDNSKYPLAMRNVGGDPLPGSKELGLTYFLLNDWKIRPYSENHTLTVNGNLYSEDGSSPYVSAIGSYSVMVINSVSNLVDSTVQQLPEIEFASFQNYVIIDVDNGVEGTDYPIGTRGNPVNNLADAKAIAVERGLNTFHLLSNLTISDGENVDNFVFKSDNWLTLTIEDGASVVNTEFTKLDIYGKMCGTWNVLNDCWSEDITNFRGWVRGGSIVNVELSPYLEPDPYTLGSSYFDNIVPMYTNIPSVLVMNENVSVSFTNSTDICEIKEMTSGSVISMGMSHGKFIINSSCTGGSIIAEGIGTIENNSSILPDTSCLLNNEIFNTLLDVNQGNWEIANNQMVFYKIDGSELMRFNLYDKNNVASEENVYKRTRI